jgi:hypothetical protein
LTTKATPQLPLPQTAPPPRGAFPVVASAM